jgi:hypothetical protein
MHQSITRAGSTAISQASHGTLHILFVQLLVLSSPVLLDMMFHGTALHVPQSSRHRSKECRESLFDVLCIANSVDTCRPGCDSQAVDRRAKSLLFSLITEVHIAIVLVQQTKQAEVVWCVGFE